MFQSVSFFISSIIESLFLLIFPHFDDSFRLSFSWLQPSSLLLETKLRYSFLWLESNSLLMLVIHHDKCRVGSKTQRIFNWNERRTTFVPAAKSIFLRELEIKGIVSEWHALSCKWRKYLGYTLENSSKLLIPQFLALKSITRDVSFCLSLCIHEIPLLQSMGKKCALKQEK